MLFLFKSSPLILWQRNLSESVLVSFTLLWGLRCFCHRGTFGGAFSKAGTRRLRSEFGFHTTVSSWRREGQFVRRDNNDCGHSHDRVDGHSAMEEPHARVVCFKLSRAMSNKRRQQSLHIRIVIPGVSEYNLMNCKDVP